MRLLLDNDGYVSQWVEKDDAGYMSDNDIVIPTPEGFDFTAFREDYRYYHLVDGVLVKDENRVLPEPDYPWVKPEDYATTDAVVNALLGVT